MRDVVNFHVDSVVVNLHIDVVIVNLHDDDNFHVNIVNFHDDVFNFHEVSSFLQRTGLSFKSLKNRDYFLSIYILFYFLRKKFIGCLFHSLGIKVFQKLIRFTFFVIIICDISQIISNRIEDMPKENSRPYP